MGSKWETVKLGDLTKWSSGGTPNKSEDSYWNGTIPWISASSMEGHLYSDSKLKITEDGLINGSRLAPANSILLLVRGSILHQKIQVGLATKAVAFNQDVKCLIVNNDMIDPWYLLLWFKAKEQDLLKIVESTGIGAGKLDTKLLMDYPVEIPPKEIKEYIRFLGKAIFDKITLNENINYNLEKMSQTLFKSWFVDFDPVIDNALDAGNPIPEALQTRAKLRQKVRNSADFKPLPTEIRSLFPSEFEETELGWVPKGWKIDNIGGLSDKIFSGGTPNTSTEEYWNGALNWFSSGETRNALIIETEKKITATGVKNSSTRLSVAGDILIASAGQGHTRGQTSLNTIDTYINQSVVCIRPIKPSYSTWLYFNLSSRYTEMRAISDSHSIRGSLTTKLISSMKVASPTDELISLFDINCSVFISKIKNNLELSRELKKLRDTLLPKLISGELSLEDLPDLNTDTEAA
ncbi:TPA: restriction endonuclease subunit S [Escherichia coli]|uniref:restriction endonuclease subunit S n=1 Tax=Escherichia coli TaxID=562 RepID=UPI0005A798F7|nr:restriction endonuclease subunit S [Escherichia coli]EFD0791299.1 restriction endonuclease subunit S [Escherichia coli]EKF3393020.1 restriction endonuclease subunit S [Escherichia coli]EKF3431162.1 restriction endonuclease subunit S [Escherichia coli]EKM0414630.1 restriction endonuclease subunit S [Escherichia coli]ELO7642304.1 restriction endonuclease subunit S [Escherichia coli]